jgi:hypothetical protein
MASKPKLLIATLIVSLLAMFTVWHYLRTTKQEAPVEIAEVSVAGGSVYLKLEPAAATTAVNSETTLTMVINTTTSKVSAAAVELTYNQTKLAVVSVTAGDFLVNTLAAPKIAGGKVTFTFAAPPASGGKQGTGTLATIKVKPLVAGSSKLVFTAKTQIVAIGKTDNVLKSATDATITGSTKPGDLNNDGKVDIFDYNVLVAKFGNPYTIFDYNVLVANYGK